MPEQTDINKSSILKALGVGIDNSKITKVAVPRDTLDTAKKKMDDYRKVIKANRHASVKNKLKIILKKGTTDEKETERRNTLTETMKKTKGWIDGAVEYFKDCTDVETLKKYQKEIISDCKTLENKAYIKKDLKCEDFNTDEYNICGEGSPKSYLENCQTAYQNIYDRFAKILTESATKDGSLDERYRKQRNEAVKKLETKLKEFKNSHRLFNKHLADFWVKAEPQLNGVIASIKKPDKEMQLKIAEARSTSEQFKDYFKNIKIREYEIKFNIYFNEKGRDSRLGFKSTFRGVVADINSLYNDLVSGHLSKTTKKMLKELNQDMEENGTVKKAANEFFDCQSKELKSQILLDKQTKKIEKLINTSVSLLQELKNELSKFDSKTRELEATYNKWLKDKKDKRLKIAFLTGFAVLGVSVLAFNNFFPLIDAKINQLEAEFDAPPE